MGLSKFIKTKPKIFKEILPLGSPGINHEIIIYHLLPSFSIERRGLG